MSFPSWYYFQLNNIVSKFIYFKVKYYPKYVPEVFKLQYLYFQNLENDVIGFKMECKREFGFDKLSGAD